MKVGIILAMDIEYRRMASLLDGKSEGRIGGHEVVLWRCGIGKVNAAVGTMELIGQHRPDCIVSSGLAGGIDARLRPLDIVVGLQTVYHDLWCGMGCEYGQVQGLPPRFEASPVLLKAALDARSLSGLKLVEGLICTGDQFITNQESLRAIKERFPEALACEMESAAIAQTCLLKNVPFLSIRIVSDTPGSTDNHQQQWDDFLASMGDHSFRFMESFLSNLPN